MYISVLCVFQDIPRTDILCQSWAGTELGARNGDAGTQPPRVPITRKLKSKGVELATPCVPNPYA